MGTKKGVGGTVCMRTLKLNWTIGELQDFIRIFSYIVKMDVASLKGNSYLYLCTSVILGLQLKLSQKLITAKIMGKTEVKVSMSLEQSLAVYSLVENGYFEDFVKDDTHEFQILRSLFGIINQKFM
jgi:hypothetical protein